MKNSCYNTGILLILFLFFNINSIAQVGIGVVSPNSSAMLDLSSTDKGFLSPRMTEAERDAITSPATGLLIYNTTTSKLNYYNGSSWKVATNGDDTVDTSTNQTIAGDKTFTGDIITEGRLMLPMGEISYFNYAGFSVPITNQASGASGNDEMAKIDPTESNLYPDRVPFVNDMFGTGTNSRLTYTGATGRYFHIALSFSYTPGTGGDVFVFGVARNGTVADSSKLFIKTAGTNDHQSSAMHVLLWLDQNDYIEFFVGNTFVSGSSIKIKSFNFFAMGM